ncbi:tripartite motif-containing protein 2-like [Anneissia japonica]|uniref:tripartite motif-containing protein 2-like n=1 Tax=Anneissia japonica TaxID=1529436 RepID=UPI00142599CF|nr:tripartite motif-containing protein 2-like [Anneissia japonica]
MDEIHDFYVISDNAVWEKTTIIELQKRRQGIRCISRNEWIPGKYKLDNLIKPVNNSKKVVVGFTPSSSTGSPHYLAQFVVQKMLANNNIGKLIPVRISKDSMIPECLSVLTSANGWEDNLYELLLGALHEEKSQATTGIVRSPHMSKIATGKALYTLKGTKDKQIFCQIHCNNELEFFCPTCQRSACKHCEHGFNCLRKKHDVLEIKTVVHAVTNTPKDIQKMLNERLDSINKARSHWEDHVQFIELKNSGCIGTIKTVYGMFKVDQHDEAFTVTKEQPFAVTVSSLIESDASKLSATLSNPSHEESATTVEYQGNGKYKITGKCNVEGDWQMKIIAGEAHIKGSPVNIKVESLGLVHTTGNIADYKEHNKEKNVRNVVLDTDGCILVSSNSKDILKFNQSGSFVARIQVRQNVLVNSMHLMSDGHMVYSDVLGRCVVMCDDKFKEIISFGKGDLKYPKGLTLNKKTGVMYVADREALCVFKFNVDDGRLLGKIGSKGSEVSQMNEPIDVTLTKEGHMIIADFTNHRIQMFDANDKFMRILVGCGKIDGKVWSPCGVTLDMDENIIVSSNHKLQLFDKNGAFIKRIDHEDDGLHSPLGIAVISNRPRRVAVANYTANNVKIFNY